MSILWLFVIVIANSIWLYSITIMGILFLALNLAVYKKMAYNANHLFTTIERNYKYLIIGDNCDYTDIVGQESCIKFLSPVKRSDQSIEILAKRLYSLVDEEKGTIILCTNEQNRELGIDIFDVPYIHENDLRKLGIFKLKYLCRLPIFFYPIGCAKLLFMSPNSVKPKLITTGYSEIREFFNKRNIKLSIYKI